MIKGPIDQEDIIIVNQYSLKVSINFIKQTLLNLQGVIASTRIVGEFNTLLFSQKATGKHQS
jgi:hypothetical protein